MNFVEITAGTFLLGISAWKACEYFCEWKNTENKKKEEQDKNIERLLKPWKYVNTVREKEKLDDYRVNPKTRDAALKSSIMIRGHVDRRMYDSTTVRIKELASSVQYIVPEFVDDKKNMVYFTTIIKCKDLQKLDEILYSDYVDSFYIDGGLKMYLC